jgi:hypothetical protein
MAESAADIIELKEHDTGILTYESHLKGHEGLYFARAKNDKILSIQDVCVSAKERGGYTGSLEDLIKHVKIFFREVVYLLRDGYGINLAGLIELFLNIGGFFKTPNTQPDPEENPVSVHVRRLHGAAKAVQGIRVRNWGPAPVPARIDQITDSKTGAVNDVLTAGGPFTIGGVMMKIAGTNAPGDRIGVSFYSLGTPNIDIAVAENLLLNEPTKIIGITPDLPAGKTWYVKIRTKYAGGANLLKETREIMSSFTIQRA